MKEALDIQVEEIALKEINDAYDWYENQSKGLGDRFRNALDEAFKSILNAPYGYETFGFHRQFALKNFPYIILYEVTKTTLYVDAVFHTSRDPKYKIR